jgi:hypothetical protein
MRNPRAMCAVVMLSAAALACEPPGNTAGPLTVRMPAPA